MAASSQIAFVNQDLRAADSAAVVYTEAGPLRTTLEPGDTRKLDPATSNCGDGATECFQPLLYGIDTVVPIIDLGQRGQWRPVSTGYQIAFAAFALLGWALSTMAVLSFAQITRISRRSTP